MARISILAEFWHFLSQWKKNWLMPIALLLLMLRMLLVLTANSALAPFMYTLF